MRNRRTTLVNIASRPNLSRITYDCKMGRTGSGKGSSASKGSSGSTSRSSGSRSSGSGSKSLGNAPHAGARVGLTGTGSSTQALFTVPASTSKGSRGGSKAAPPSCGPCAQMTTNQYRTAYTKEFGNFPYAHDADHTVNAVRDSKGRATVAGTNIAGNYHPVLAQVQRSPNFVGDTKEQYYARTGAGQVYADNKQNVANCNAKYDYTYNG